MKKYFLFIFSVAVVAFGYAQPVTSFSTDPDKFLKELDQYMSATKSDQNIEAINKLQKLVKDNKVNPAWMAEIIKTSNAMIGRMMAPAPHFNNYVNAIINAAEGGKTDQQFLNWSTWLDDIIKDQHKGDNGNFLKAVEFSNAFFKDGSLSSSPGKVWTTEATDFQFSYADGKAKVTFPTTTLKGYSHNDTVRILQTAGYFLPLEGKWQGKSGKVDWGRAGLDPSKVYCTFKDYTVNVVNYNYIVDTVTFYHADYFKQPIQGKLTDKITAGGDSTGFRYPRFESYEGGAVIKDIAPDVSYSGNFALYGNKVMGTSMGDDKAMLTFYARDGKTKVLTARSNAITIKKGEELGAEKAEVSIYFGTDSIYHPQLNLVYKIPKREMRLLRGETGQGQAKFFDSYHNHEFQTDAIFWNLDSTKLNLKILSGVGKKPGVFESANYFNKEIIRKQQGVASYEPLSVLKRLYEKTGSRDMNATEVARALDPHLTEGECKTLFYELVANGFITYNEELGVVTIKDKAINYVLANAKKIDYDIIRITSAPKTGNDFIDLKNNNIDLKGVERVPISDTAFVYFIPKDKSINLQKDRNMEFDGLMYAGRMDMYGQKFKFNYTPFTVDLTQVDTMVINVQDSDKVDAYGNPILKPLRSRVENLKGLLEIDAPINKSGRTRLPQFPRLYSREKSYIYYDDSTVAKGAYNRKSFFFEIEPFRLDSLNNFSGDIINWQGKLVSGGIFPDIKDSIHIQGDGSLGFKSETPPGGYDLYKGKGKYYGKFELNYNGMKADGRIIHSTADFTSHDIQLYPDSMKGTTDSFTIAKTFEGVKTPAVKGLYDKIYWRPNADSMLVSMTKPENPFAMYDDGFTSFKGNLMLTSKGLHGDGTLDWNEATLSSKDFTFRTMDLSADTAALNIKTTGDKVTFKTPNVSAKVDFKTRIGDFVSNQKNIPTEFSYNQYTTNINQFKWFMDEKILDFKAPPAGPGEYFTSTRADQKGLKFLGKRAIYYLVSSLLRVEQVPEIKVADASVVPDSGVVVIEAEAKMQQLKNATIYADTITKIHKIEHATVDIYSKAELKGVGDYTYTTKGIKEVINFTDIGCKKSTYGHGRKATEDWQLFAKGPIAADRKFVIYPDVSFNGDVGLTSTNPKLNFKGFAKLQLKYPLAYTTDFFVNQDEAPDTLALKFDTSGNSNGNKVIAGICLNQSADSAYMYTALMAPKQDVKDNAMFKALGIVSRSANGDYVFGNEKKIRENTMRGNVMRYDDKKGTITAEGRFSLGANFGLIKNMAAGTAEVILDSDSYKFNLSFGLDMQMGDKLQEKFEQHMLSDNADNQDVSYETEKQRKVVYELSDERQDKKLLEDFDKNQVFNKRPKALDHYIVFNDVHFVFDTADYLLRSTGKIGVAMIGKKVINKKLDGYIEIQYKGGYDVFTIYLVTGVKEWFYFEYHPGTLGILSSYDDMNNIIGATPPDKRRVKGPNNKFYIYTIGSSANKAEFVSYNQDKAAGVYHPRLEPKVDMPAEYGDSIITAPVSPDDSSSYENQLKQEEQQQITPEQREQMKQEEEQNNLEQMKMSGAPIMSGPPPDRLPAKETKTDSVSTTPAQPQTNPGNPGAPEEKKESAPPKSESNPAVPPPSGETTPSGGNVNSGSGEQATPAAGGETPAKEEPAKPKKGKKKGKNKEEDNGGDVAPPVPSGADSSGTAPK